MNANAEKLLINLLILIVSMLCHSQEYALKDKQELLTKMSQLQAAMDEGRPRRPEPRGR